MPVLEGVLPEPTLKADMFLFSKDEDSLRHKQLRALSLFSTLNPRELKTVDGLLHQRTFLQDEVIFDQGEECVGLQAALEGLEVWIELVSSPGLFSVVGEAGDTPRNAR